MFVNGSPFVAARAGKTKQQQREERERERVGRQQPPGTQCNQRQTAEHKIAKLLCFFFPFESCPPSSHWPRARHDPDA